MSKAVNPPKDDGGDGGEDAQRINKREFIRKMAQEADLPINITSAAYEAFIKTLLEHVRAGTRVNLTGFGHFYWQRHKGHRVQFAGNKTGMVDDYTVLKFSATRESNEFLDKTDADLPGLKIPGTRVRYGADGVAIGELAAKKNEK